MYNNLLNKYYLLNNIGYYIKRFNENEFKHLFSNNKYPYIKIFNKYPSLYNFKKSYNNLPSDKYYLNNDPPVRHRRYAKYNIKIYKNTFNILYDDDCSFKQNVDDSRNQIRYFDPIESKFIYNNDIMKLISYICSLSLYSINYKPKNAIINMHQVRQIAYPNKLSDNAPEGIHQDGADFIVSALVLNRYNVIGGETIIYDTDKKNIIYRTILENEEGIFQEDRHLWHDVTKIKSADNKNIGIRDILGFDITFKD
jgi:hypothetical protein